MKRIIAVAIVALVSACASTPEMIVGTGTNAQGQPTQAPILPIKDNPTLVTDLQSAAYNLDNAVAVGALPANDPAGGCIHSVLQQAGVEVPLGSTPPKSFVPKNDGVVSLGSIAYIQIQQAKVLLPGLTVPMDCKTMIGQFVIDGISSANKLAPGAALRGLLP